MRVLLCTFNNPGYLYPAIAVGRELRARGNAVYTLCRSRAASAVHEAGLALLPADDYGDAHAFSVAHWAQTGNAQYAAVRRAARSVRADALVTSVLCHGALLAAETLDLPIVVMGLAAYLWPYQSGGDGEPESIVQRRWRLRETLRRYDQVREQVGLSARRDRQPERPLLGSGLLLRGDPALEYPGARLPEGVHHAGPCPWEPRPDAEVVERLTGHVTRVGKPLVYVHLGRTFGGESLWPRLNATFTAGPFQAVVERARSGPPRPAASADVIVVRQPWMGPLVEMAEVVLASGTSAPVLAALRHGRPMVLAPAGSEQPLLAEACRRAGVAVRFPDAGADLDGGGVLKAASDSEPMKVRIRQLGARLNRSAGPSKAAAIVLAAASGRAIPASVRAGDPCERKGEHMSQDLSTGPGQELPRTLLDEAFLADPYTRLAPLRAAGPVATTTTPRGREVWLITRDADVRRGFSDPRLSLQPGSPPPRRTRRALDVTLLNHEPPHHSRIRELAVPSLTPGRIRTHRPAVEAIAAGLLDSVDPRRPVELTWSFAHPFSFQVLCELFAIPRDTRPSLYSLVSSVFCRSGAGPASENVDRLEALVRREVERRQAGSGGDLLSSIVTAWDPAGEVSHDEVVSLCATLLLAGFDSTAQMIGMSVVELLARPDLVTRLRAEPDLMPRAVQELLRLQTPGPFGTTRTATEDINVSGATIPSGAAVLLSIASANRDPARHDGPDRFEPDRPSAARHLTFGLGRHYCLGASLARLELEVALAALVERFPRMALGTPVNRLRWRGSYQNRGLQDLTLHPDPAAVSTWRPR